MNITSNLIQTCYISTTLPLPYQYYLNSNPSCGSCPSLNEVPLVPFEVRHTVSHVVVASCLSPGGQKLLHSAFPDAKTATVAKAFIRQWLARFGVPAVLGSDRLPQRRHPHPVARLAAKTKLLPTRSTFSIQNCKMNFKHLPTKIAPRQVLAPV